MRGLARAVVLAASALLCFPASAEVYKSVDEHGNVTFSQKPPKDVKSEVVKPRFSKPPTSTTGAAPFVPPAQPGALPSATAPAAAPELTPEQQAAKHKNCANAKERLQQLQGPRANRLQYVNEKQELAYLTPELLESRIKEAQDALAKNCVGDELDDGATTP